ncbi:MAG TPA: aspartate kinase [Flavobacteriaceae bacterium]|nr:aspartate kinase [Flavobacteriaceae bacterium]MCB9212150.1 aspartate kinase [Alteromonas sp.]HPF10471.1 aspartate kinase [Flavobacteriaceae bacterium]HQU21780.1 aspartate kinase [Flavobacteriaceae bacterium]HQU64682.1 aspartate kinase [Flavobacteriaceae bacterium]
MKVFKFGGASVKDAEGVKNVKKVLDFSKEKDLVVVISAMGKTTNALEVVVNNYIQNPSELEASIHEVYHYHQEIIHGLFPNPSHTIHGKVSKWFQEMKGFLDANKSKNHAFVYDQIVSFGELISTTIVSEFLNEEGLKNTWLDVRQCIRTDDYYRDARVQWEETQQQILEAISPKGVTITQGFLGAEGANNFTTTLGREGSDYTAAIFAYCLNAQSVTIWKDVPGVLNADPRFFTNTQLLHHISYREAIELAFYGASVIHPKTLQPLQRKEIPLFVKSFVDPAAPGTCVGKGVLLDPMTSCFILKKNQVLISLSSLDFSFMMEDNISEVFNLLHRYKMKVELIQNSAISFSVCVDNKYNHLEPLLTKLRERFKVVCYYGVTLYTIRHSKPVEIQSLTQDKEVLLKQESSETVQLVVNE